MDFMSRSCEESGKRSLAGSVTVEAAIVVPVMVMVVIPFLLLMRMLIFSALFEDDVQDTLQEMAVISYVLQGNGEKEETGDSKDKEKRRERAKEAAFLDVSGTADKEEAYDDLMRQMDGFLFEGEMGEAMDGIVLDAIGLLYMQASLREKWSSEELEAWGVKGGWSGISFLNSAFLYSDDSRGKLIRAELTISWSSLAGLYTPQDGTISKVTRAFFGASDSASSSSKGNSEEAEDRVYQIGNGMHYHVMSCFLIDKQKTSLTQSEAQGKGLLPCSLCGGGSGTVYATSGGDRYHTSSCSVLFPNLKGMTKGEAMAQGLTPCGLCYGNNEYFK